MKLISRPALGGASVLAIGATAAYATTCIRQVHAESPVAFAQPSQFSAVQKPLTKPLTKTFTSIIRSKELTVSDIETINHDTKKITFNLPTSDEVSGLQPTSAILVQHHSKDAWFPTARPYTPISDPDQRNYLQLLVKRYPNGTMSSYLHSLSAGDKVTLRGPVPGSAYAYTPSTTPRTLLLIAGGAGITPIYSLAKGVLGDSDDKTRLEIVWGVNGERDVVLGKELAELQKRFPDRLGVTVTVSKPIEEGAQNFKKGYVDESLLKEVMQRSGEKWGDAKGTKVFLCGPPAMEEALAGSKGTSVLKKLGVEKKEIHRF